MPPTDSQLTDTLAPAARAAAAVLADKAPAAWPAVAPYLPRLFSALEQGHSHIELSAAEAGRLVAAVPLVGAPGDFCPLIVDEERLFLGRLWQLEQDIAAELWRLSGAGLPPVDAAAARANLAAWFAAAGSAGQQAAAALTLLKPWVLINGGPGTGKTTTVAKVLALLTDNARRQGGALPRIALAAPTGKAAAHLAHALQAALARFEMPEAVRAHLQTLSGQTVHRLLGLAPPLLHSRYDAETPLPVDVLVVDEASMLDLPLLHRLLRALRCGCRLVLLGDHQQLPAVGVGDVLGALAQATCVAPALAAQLAALLPHQPFAVAGPPPPLADHVATLSVSHRFDDHSGIGRLAAATAGGDANAALAAFSAFPEQLAWAEVEAALWPRLYALQGDYWQAVAQGNAEAVLAAINRVAVLTAWREDAAAFNRGYAAWLARHGHAGAGAWFAGQMLMITENDYGNGLYNGDIGVVLAQADGVLSVCFAGGNGPRRFSPARLPAHEPAFAVTVHKSQGSEYDTVWLLPPSADGDVTALFDRTLLYTAVTRARQCFVFAGRPEVLAAAVSRRSQRRSGLKNALAAQATQPERMAHA